MFSGSFLLFVLGTLSALVAAWIFHIVRIGSYQKLLDGMIESAEKEIKDKQHRSELSLQKSEFEHQKKCDDKERLLSKKMDEEKKQLEQKLSRVDQLQKKNEKLSCDLQQKMGTLQKQQDEFFKQKQQVLEEKKRLVSALEQISKLTQKEAEEKLFEKLSLQVKKDCAVWGARYLKEKKEEADKEGTKLIAGVIHRLASSCASHMTISTVSLPQEEIKSRIIGREGRNINHLENLLGVNLLVDETPKTVLISALDPLRKAVAKETLEKLIQDGRIHPTRIDEIYAKACVDIEKKIFQKAEDFAIRLGITDLHPKILKWMARLYLMDSLSQNLLEHSYQVALILGLMAQELHLNVHLARRIGFLHDIGKAAPPEMEGTHALIGQKFALKHGESEEVANGIGCHHDEILPKTLEGSLCGAADSLSASRPGARSESLHYYIKRIKKLEEIATSFPEVEKAYALQSGKEIRVITLPDKVDDASLTLLAQSLAKKVQEELKYPGRIKVSVLRQHQVIEYAT